MQKKVQVVSQTVAVDATTGEVMSRASTQTFTVDKEPPFVKLYIADIAKLYTLPKGSSVIMYELVKRVGYDGLIVINAAVKRKIAEDSEVSVSHVSNSLTRFISSNVMTRVDRGVFQFNPDIIAKGLWRDVQQQRTEYIELRLRYSTQGRETIITPSV